MPHDAQTPTTVAIRVAGQTIVLDHSGAAWFGETRDLVVADLHFEKGSAFAARGQGLLPPYDTAETLRRLDGLCRRLKPARVICLGDTLHDLAGEDRLSDGDRSRLAALVAAQDWVWVAGNHDPAPPTGLGGAAVERLKIDDVLLHHDVEAGPDAPIPAGEIVGHYHPKALVRTRARKVSGRCFVADGRRLILPAFGAYAGGLNVRDPAIEGLLSADYRAYMIGRRGLFAFRRDQLAADPKRAA
jgi:DNA ligase-associated metallophosphoesterase